MNLRHYANQPAGRPLWHLRQRPNFMSTFCFCGIYVYCTRHFQKGKGAYSVLWLRNFKLREGLFPALRAPKHRVMRRSIYPRVSAPAAVTHVYSHIIANCSCQQFFELNSGPRSKSSILTLQIDTIENGTLPQFTEVIRKQWKKSHHQTWFT